MAPFGRLSLLAAVAGGVLGQTTLSNDGTTATGSTATATTPTGTYESFSTQITLGTDLGTTGSVATSMGTDNVTRSTISSSSSDTVTFLTGSAATTTTLAGNFSSSTTSAIPTVTNTQPCNNYAEFCTRKYSNITNVACHNSPFTTSNNLAANQQYDVTAQLNDGVRFLQAQIQWPTGGSEPHFCHTSCDILDAGPITDWLGKVKTWVAAHPYDVITILLGNGNYSVPSLYVPYIEQTGILRYIYTPSVAPMTLDDWPTLSEMVLRGQRVVMFMDYMANQTAYPWLLDEFSQLWETPFDPTDQKFPCTVQRPPNLAEKDAKDRLYMINHNLNVELSILGTNMLVPARTELNVTNNVTGTGSLGLSANNCRSDWGRPPNFLNVDYYNTGGFPGSVFEVAAQMNNVTYNRQCCGQATNGAERLLSNGFIYSLAMMALFWAFL
ncbi:PLC-like phosphodiesterase [Annulohypoxylon maeteangense]|uniref:PLC-like phosphodiesterase n=1 Tax=Annulohypoxylon maeteangense TaxID=1927788 RepID=UPI0020085156|nr:PLC-like phosphodiesterase [Annulohypoxylon maeteangense]KAI0885548.1 PLC-like phosphodiesterase [Annulohypoxylon maeteangense]